MKNFTKTLRYLLTLVVLFAVYGCYVYKSSFADWEITLPAKTEIAWADFTWTNQTINGKYYEKTAMLIPARIAGIDTQLEARHSPSPLNYGPLRCKVPCS